MSVNFWILSRRCVRSYSQPSRARRGALRALLSLCEAEDAHDDDEDDDNVCCAASSLLCSACVVSFAATFQHKASRHPCRLTRVCNKCPWPCGVSRQLSFATLRQWQRKKVCKLTSSKRGNIMLRGVPLPQCIVHACRGMQKHVWTCICLQLFLNCIEKLSTNTALCISQRQPHTQLAPTTCHSFCFCLAFLSSGSLALLCGRPADRPNDMHAISLSAPGEFPIPICPHISISLTSPLYARSACFVFLSAPCQL